MSYPNQNDFYQTDWNQGWDGYDMSSAVDPGPNNQGFGEPQFGTFDYGGQASHAAGYGYAPSPSMGDPSAAGVHLGTDYGSAFAPPPPPMPPATSPYTGSIFHPTTMMQTTMMQTQHSMSPNSNLDSGLGLGSTSAVGDDFEDEPPLLEELGINFDHILQKTWSVLHLLKETDPQVVGDSDMAGPLVFCFALMATLLLGGKVAFGYIYGLGLMGCLGMYLLLNLMSVSGVDLSCVVSILGYCLLPMVLLSGFSIVFSLQGLVGMGLAGLAIAWCGLAAAKLFVTALGMDRQQLIVMYPCCLVYGVFALLTVF